MNEKLSVVICKNFERELSETLESLNLTNLRSFFHAADCKRCHYTRQIRLEEVLQTELSGKVISLPEGFELFKNKGNENRSAHFNMCHGMLISESILNQYIARGDYLVTPGWLMEWEKYVIEEAKFDRETARAFFGESIRHICILDTGVYPNISERIKSFTSFIEKPYEVLHVGLDFFKVQIQLLTYNWHNELMQDDIKGSYKQVSDYAMLMDFLTKIAGLLHQGELIENIFELFVMMTGATQLAYLPIVKNQGQDMIFYREKPYLSELFHEESLESVKGIQIAGSMKGFIARLSFNGTTLGYLEVEGIQFAHKMRSYVEMSYTIMDIFSLAIFNSRLYEESLRHNINLEQIVKERTQQLIRVNEGLETTNALLEEEIAERYEAEQKLTRAKEEAERANASKTTFLENMSHEIRTPINGILGMTELAIMARGEGDYEELEEYLSLVKKSTQSLVRVINDILDYTKLEKDLLVIETKPFDLSELLREIVILYSASAIEKGLDMTWYMDEDLPKIVTGDGILIRQVLSNLIGNAIKFTKTGSVKVMAELIGASKTDVQLRLSVKDTGIGIAMDEQVRIFDRFTQLDSSYSKKYQGTGLGLATAEKIVGKMGGELSVDSVLNEGSTFSFILNLSLPEEITEVVPQRGIFVREELKGLVSKPVLVVDDDETSREFVLRLLDKYGVSANGMCSGKDAVSQYKKDNYCMIFMDVQMPQMDGLEATRLIRSMEADAAHHTPIIALTAYAFKEDEENCLRAGMDAYLSKPVDVELFYKTLLRYLG